METRDALVAAIGGRYGRGKRPEKTRILDEFVAVTGFHRKHAMRLLRSGGSAGGGGPRPGRRVYGEAVRTALLVVWEASTGFAVSGCGRSCRCWSRRWSDMGTLSSMPMCAAICWR